MISRRQLLLGATSLVAGTAALGGYAFAIEPGFRLNVTRYRVTPRGWPVNHKLRIGVIADPHVGEPYMSLARLRAIVARTQALKPDLIVLLGDYEASWRIAGYKAQRMPAQAWAEVLGRLSAPLGVHAILGNHDWWDDPLASRQRVRPPYGRTALEAVGIPVYENDAVRLVHGGRPFWLAGLGDQMAFPRRGAWPAGIDDLAGTLRKVTDDAPVILMAHEPDIFPRVPERVGLTLCGHTHGGQVRIGGYAPIVYARTGQRYVYGHYHETERHMIVSGGLGCSMVPVRLGSPPEIVEVEVG